MKYRKKPVVIEAIQWTGDNYAEVATFASDRGGMVLGVPGAWTLTVPTLEGDMTANQFDWIICGVQREFYPCKPDIFAATYEAVE